MRFFLPKFILKVLLSALIIAFLVLAPFSLFSKLDELNYSLNTEYDFSSSKIIELWNVDTFEGGSGARSGWLEKKALAFEKQNKGIYFVVRNLTLSQLELNLQSGNHPSLISFGIGAGSLISDKIISLSNSFGVRDDLLNGGKLGGKLKAIPIMLGGYNLISNGNLTEKNDNLLENFVSINIKNKSAFGYGNADNIVPLLSLYLNGVNKLNNCYEKVESLDSFGAYDEFISGKFVTLLGTQRDYFRCRNRENNLKMQNNSYYFLPNYSDLIQYMSVFKTDNETEKLCEKFIEFVLSEKSQQSLSDIKMFSVLNENIYTDEYKAYNNSLLKPLKTLSVFLSQDSTRNLKDLLNDYFYNGINNKKEIEKYLV